MNDKCQAYIQLMRLDRPIGILLLLWPTLSALWIAAEGWPDPLVLVIFVLGVVVMRSAGCVINDYADRHIDGKVVRTMNRPLATGALSENDALKLFAGLGVLAFVLVIFLNDLTILMSIVGLFLAATYPFMKRYTHLPQIYLGAAFGWAIPMAFAAQTGTVPMIAWLLFVANVIWSTIYDTFYAMADREDDVLAGVKSTAILFGDDDKAIIAILQVTFLIAMLMVGSQLELSFIYYTGVLVTLGLFLYQQHLVRDRQAAACLQAFLNNNWVGATLFAGIVMHYAFIKQ
ncbi:MAG: 4-hydroxybenzoate octaprenyltransferase [Gammaproteobacteria bacterium]|jgi:4-hydroxybenzoate polyprenyltransferase|nr:4-hydroxybenzoate octaprenyltransferase [Gammaproteobacteria bacterium]